MISIIAIRIGKRYSITVGIDGVTKMLQSSKCDSLADAMKIDWQWVIDNFHWMEIQGHA